MAGRDDFIEYRLPETVLVIRGTRVERTDEALKDTETHGRTVRTQSQVSLETEAHDDVLVARIVHGRLNDTDVSLELTEDRRLTSASSESEGQGGKVVLGIVSAAAGVAGLAAGLFPVTAGAAGVIAAAAVRDTALLEETRAAAAQSLRDATGETAEQLKADLHADAAKMPRDAGLVAELYLASKEEEALERQRFVNRCRALFADVASALWDVDQAGDDDAKLQAATSRVKRCRAMLEVARAELARLDAVFEAWHAGMVKEDRKPMELRLPLSKVLEAVGDCPPADDKDALEAQKVLRALGLGLTVTHPDSREREEAGASRKNVKSLCMHAGKKSGEPPESACGVIVRQPRRLTLNLYQRYDGSAPTSNDGDGCDVRPDPEKEEWRLVESRRCSVADDKCHHEFVSFRTSWWGRKKVGLELWPGGGLKKYSSVSTSQAAAMAETAADVPAKIGGALKDSAAVLEQVGTLRGEDDGARQLAALKQLVQTKTWQLALAGLNATTGQVQELEHLKQQLAILQSQADIDSLFSGTV